MKLRKKVANMCPPHAHTHIYIVATVYDNSSLLLHLSFSPLTLSIRVHPNVVMCVG